MTVFPLSRCSLVCSKQSGCLPVGETSIDWKAGAILKDVPEKSVVESVFSGRGPENLRGADLGLEHVSPEIGGINQQNCGEG